MPACPTCGFVLTIKEWSLGNCTACTSPLKDMSQTRDPIAAVAAPADITFPPSARPGWGTVRAGLALVIIAIVMFWTGLAVRMSVAGSESNRVGRNVVAVPQTMVLISYFGIGLAVILSSVGVMMCAATPGPWRCRFWAWGACGLLVLWLASLLGGYHMNMANSFAEFSRDVQSDYEYGDRDDHEERWQGGGRGQRRQPPFSEWTVQMTGHFARLAGMIGLSFFVAYLWITAASLNRLTLSLNLLLILVLVTAANGILCIASFGGDSISMLDRSERSMIGTNDSSMIVWMFLAFAVFAWFTVATYLLRKRITQLLCEESVPV